MAILHPSRLVARTPCKKESRCDLTLSDHPQRLPRKITPKQLKQTRKQSWQTRATAEVAPFGWNGFWTIGLRNTRIRRSFFIYCVATCFVVHFARGTVHRGSTLIFLQISIFAWGMNLVKSGAQNKMVNLYRSIVRRQSSQSYVSSDSTLRGAHAERATFVHPRR